MHRLALSLLLFACLLPARLLACRYNVRDVGFVDFEAEAHHLYCFVENKTPAATVSGIREAARTALRDANVLLEFINVDTQPGHPALASLPSAPKAFPSAVLLSPDGPSLPVAVVDAAGHVASDLASVLESLVVSPAREALIASVTRAFGTILLLEGSDADANQHAHRTITDAIEQIRGHMKSLPKVIAEPPAVQVLDAASLAREKILLWTLRLDLTPAPLPRAAVFYGRGRWIGPLMKGEEISARNLVGLFSIIGADCECDLDLAWTLGTRLPLRWAETLGAPLAKALGFDPENPLIKMEISTLVNRRGSIRPEKSPAPVTASASSPSQPSSSESASTPKTPEAPKPALPPASIPPPPNAPRPDPASTTRDQGSTLAWAALAAGGLLVAGFAVSLLRRARRQGRLD